MNSSELRGFLTGLILGDGHIDKGITQRAFYIKSIQKDFIDQIYNELSSCTNFKMNIKHVHEQERGDCHHKGYWQLYIKHHPYFAKKYHHFYDDQRRRIVSRDAIQWLTPYGLANWYMSDGYVCLVGKERGDIYNRRVDICTDRYDLETINRLRDMLNKKFGIITSLSKRGNRYRIRIKPESYRRFFEIIEPYLVESMKYKMYLGYKYQPKWMSDSMWQTQERLRSATTLPAKAAG